MNNFSNKWNIPKLFLRTCLLKFLGLAKFVYELDSSLKLDLKPKARVKHLTEFS